MKKIATILIFIHQMAFSQNGTETIRVTDLLKIKTVGSISLSNDGSKVACSVTNIEPDGDLKWEYKYVSQLYTGSTAGTSIRQITFSKEGASQPTWSPDGKQLAFVRTVDTKPQIFLLMMEGGEPMQLTKSKYGANNPRWSPDGKQLLFTGNISLKELFTDSILNPKKEIPEWPYEKPGFTANRNLLLSNAKADPDGSIEEIRNYLGNNEKDKKAKVLNKLQFQEESTTSSEMNFTQIFITNTTNISDAKSLTHGFYSYTNPRFINSGKEIIFEADVDPTEHPDRSQEREIWMINNDGSNLHKILGKNGIGYNSAAVSPTGKWLAFQYATTNMVNLPALAIMPLNGTEKDIVTIPWDRSKSNLTWSNDEKYLWFLSQQNGGSAICRVNMDNKKVETFTENNAGVLNMDIQNNVLAFSKTEVSNPSELFIANSDVKNIIQLSSLNTAWLKTKKLSFPVKKTFKNDKGATVEYWVMKPVQYEAGKKYPLLLEIHGGPAAMWGPGEASMWHEFQFFCAKGYGVVYSNPRGSGGYGENFLRDNIKDWGNGPTSDVLAALDGAVAEGWADTSKLAITGGSYAGYLTAWIVGQHHRFKAACAQRGVYDLRTFFGEGNAWRLVPNYFGGYPWETATKAILERESPINYVQNVTTPLIIFHGENDLRTGVIQSEQFYKSLKVLGKEVEYVRHPGATHEITRSGNSRQRIDQMLRTYEFFERYIKK